MEKRDICKSVFAAILLLLSLGAATAGSLKTGSLEQKIYEISTWRARIMDKIDQAIEIRTRLEQRFAELCDEIKAEQIRFEIHSHQQALQNLRIRYNLSLIQIIRAYTTRLNERIDYFQTGSERLRFMIQEINDDIAIINTLEDMQIEKLTSRIDRLLNEFIPEIHKPIFNAADIQPEPILRIWNEINLDLEEKKTMLRYPSYKG